METHARGAESGEYLCTIAAYLMFLHRGDGHAPPVFATGYRNSHFRFDRFPHQELLAMIYLEGRTLLREGESARASVSLGIPAYILDVLCMGDAFTLVEGGRPIVVGTVRAIKVGRRLA